MQSFAQFDEHLQSIWNAALPRDPLASMPFMTYTWHAHWFSCFGSDERLSILADTDTGVIIPLSIKDAIARFSGGAEIADYLDAVGAPNQKGKVWAQALPFLKAQGVTALSLRNIHADSPTLTFFRSLTGSIIKQEDTTPVISLPASFDDYLLSLDRKDRHELKRKMKKFEAEHDGIMFTHAKGDSISVSVLLTLMRNDPDKLTFLTPPMEKFFTGLPTAVSDSIMQFMLYKGDQIIATTLAFRTPDSLLLYNSGFDPAYPGSGWYIKVKTIAWAIDQHIPTYNLLQGNERYKYDLGAKDNPVYNISLPL